MHILHTVFYTFPKVLTRRICSSIKWIFSWWSFPLFSWPYCVMQGLYCWEKLDVSHSQQLKGWMVQTDFTVILLLRRKITWNLYFFAKIFVIISVQSSTFNLASTFYSPTSLPKYLILAQLLSWDDRQWRSL